MPKKLRKMLGNVNDALIADLMNLIDTQSRETIARWCAGFATDIVLPIYEKHCPGDDRPRRMLAAALDCADGRIKFADVKRIRAQEWNRTNELEANPIAMAAARAIVDTAIMVWQTPTHSLGVLWYGSAAVAYDRAGLNESDGVYDAIAQEVAENYFNRLQAVAVENEPKPVKCKWNC